jgi:hypothetical protein
VIPSEDVLLLGFIYSGAKTSAQFTGLCRILASQFGHAISTPSLRHAILARAAIYLPANQFGDRHERHKQLAQQAILRKFNNPDEFDEGDIFAACTLAAIAWRRQSNDERLVHHRGCLAMMKHLAENSQRKPLSDFLTRFRPYIHDMLNLYDTLVSIVSAEKLQVALPQQRITFGERLNCFTVGLSGGQSAQPGTAHDEAILDVLNDLFMILVGCILRLARQELAMDFGRDEVVATVCESIKAQLKDKRLREAMAPVTQMVHYQQVKLACRILAAPVIFDVFDVVEVNSMAENLLQSYRSKYAGGSSKGSYSNYCYTAGLALAGLALKFRGPTERTYTS